MVPGSVVLGRYHLHEQVGAGGSGVVWRATDQVLHQLVALKRVSFAGLGAEQARLTRDRALREARLAAQLNAHPRVITVYDVQVDEGDIWLVMEYLPSRSLRELLYTNGRLDPTAAARIGAQVADALAAAHARGIEHRDVKPGNVLIGVDGAVKLADFGISHLTGDPHLTHTGITGTPAYLAPEVVGRGESSSASDVFSLGSTLYAAVEGQPPFGIDDNTFRLGIDDNTFRLLNIVRNGIIRPPAHAGPLEPLLLRLLQLDPNARPDAATTRDILTQLATRLTETTEHLHPQPGTPAQPKTRWWPPPRRTALAAGALIAVAGTAGAIGMITLTGNTSQGETPSADVPPPAPIAVTTTAAPPAPLDPSIQTQRNADPCPLIDVDELEGFGQAQITTPPFPDNCQATITSPDGAETYLQVFFELPGQSAAELGGELRRIGERTIVRKSEIDVAGTKGCQDWLMPITDEPLISITALTYDEPADLCGVTDAATNAAVDELERNGVTYTPDRLKSYSLAGINACTTLDDSILRSVRNIDPSEYYPGFADWSCFWDTADDDEADDDDTSIELYFGLGTPDPAGGEPRTIAGKKAFLNDAPQECDAYVEHRPAAGTRAAEMFFVAVNAPRPTDEVCDLAFDLATAVEEKLPG